MRGSHNQRLYLIPVLSKALDILELLEAEGQPLVLETIHKRTRISKTTVYRILKTLVHRGYLAHSKDGSYRVVARQRKLRFGFASQSGDMPFSIAVEESLRAAATDAGVDLVVLDNRYDGAIAVQNAEAFVRDKVDLVIEFQIDQQVAPIIADKIAAANIPMIAVEIPHPHATFFGVDNYRVGFAAGELLARHARVRWSEVDWVLGLDIEAAGPIVQSRITGAFEGVRSVLPSTPVECFVRMDVRGLRELSYTVVRDFLKRHPQDRHILIAAATDTSALGAIEAIREQKREKHVAVVGQDCLEEMQQEMLRDDSPAVGSVSHEVSSYGPRLVQLGLALLRGETVAPYNFAEYKVLTRDEAMALTSAQPG